MSLKKMSDAALNAWVDGLVARTRVIGIQTKDDRFDFRPLRRASDLRLDYDVSLTPPNKACFQPAEETLLRFQGAQFESVIETEPFVLLGVHPYDVVAIAQMDKIFAMDNADTHYLARREAATIVACDVQTVSENCYAGCMGAATVDEGFDVLLTRVGEGYLADARTDKGEALLAGADAKNATKADEAAREKVWKKNQAALRKHDLKVSLKDVPALLAKSAAHPVWKERAELCFSCGSCTNVCPTCYCFDVADDVNWDLKSGRRKRAWDGCQLAKFARVAGGHNFRKDRAARYRHRYYRKGMYVAEMIGQCACVGCGRCITACVAKIANLPEVYNRLLEDK